MASKINSVDLGPIWLQSGDGVPNHLGVKGTIFIDLANAGQYINSNGLSNWDKFLTSSSGGTASFGTIGGSPYDNLLLGAELNSKFNVTGGTISGNTNILGGLTANTISATTYQNLPLDIRVTGGTYTNGTATFRNNTGGTFTVTGFKTSDLVVTGGTYNDVTDIITFRNSTGGTFNVTGITDTFVSGMTFNTGNYNLIIGRNDGVSFTQNLGILASDMNVTGGTYNINTGIVTFTNNSGGTFQVTGFTSGMTDSYTTGAILSGNSITFNNNTQGPNYYNVSLNPLLSGKTDNTTFSSYTASTNTALNNKYDKSGGTVSGNVLANSFIKSGGTPTQFLMADGSVSVAGGSGTISGSGTSGQVSFWNGPNSQTGDTSLLWDNANKRFGVGNIIAPNRVTIQYNTENLILVKNTIATGKSLYNAGNDLGNTSIYMGINNSAYVTTPQYGKAGDTFIRSTEQGKDLNIFNGSNTTDSAIRFLNGNAGISLERMRITYDGNVGIGAPTPNHKLEVNGFIASNGFFKSGSTATDILLGNGSSVSTNTFHQLRGSYGAGGENIDDLITSGNWLLSTLSTGTKPSFTIINFVVIKSQEPSSFITQVAYADATGRHAVRSSTDIGVTWSPWVETFYGSGTTNTVSKWTGQFSQGNSNIVDNGSNVAINSYAYTPLNIGIGGTHSTSMKLNLSGVISGGTTAYGIFNQPSILSSVTTAAYYNRTLAQTEAAPFTLGAIYHNFASQGVFGSGSSVNQQIGFYVASSLVDAGNNIGIRSQIPSNTGGTNWNNYHDGTAPNYFAGSVNVGTTHPMSGAVMTLRSDDTILVLKNILNGSTATPRSRKISWFTNVSNECASIDVPDSLTNVHGVPIIFTTKDSSPNVLTEKMRIAVGGNVGIGTSTPVGKFNVVTGVSGQSFNMNTQENGSISFNNNSSKLCSPTISSKSDTAIGLSLIAGTLDSSISPDMRFNVRELDNTDFTGLTSTAFRFDRFSTPLIDILRNGSMGIGITTPNAKLQVVDTQVGLPSDTLILGNASGVSGSTSGIVFAPSASQDGLRGAKISALQKGSNNIDLLFSTGNGVVPTEKMRLTAIGNLGIGTATPSSKFHIADISGGTFFDGSNATYNRWKSTTSNPVNGKDLLFSTQGAGTTPDLYITTNGNVGIGTATPNNKLEVVGNVKATSFSISALNTAPASSGATGTIGEIRYDANFMYVCTATNTWKRSPLSSW